MQESTQNPEIDRWEGWQPTIIQTQRPPLCETCGNVAAAHTIGLAKPGHRRRTSREISVCPDCFDALMEVLDDTWGLMTYASR